MLPYGTLWKLDEMLHAAAPPPRRTTAVRRRQALFYFVWGISLVSVFLIPFHYASLRRLRIDSERELLGLVAPTVDLTQLHIRQDQALQRLKTWSTARWVNKHPERCEDDNVGDADVTADFALAFYLHPSSRTRLDGVFAHPYVQAVAGGGAGVLWPRLGDAAEAPDAPQHVPRARTLNEVAVDAAEDPLNPAKCLIALRRDLLQAGSEGIEYDEKTDLVNALQETLSQDSGLYRINVGGPSHAGKMVVDAGDGQAATENVLAALLLWLTGRHKCSHAQEEAISRALAVCQAPLSRSLRMSFGWSAAPGAARAMAPIVATVQEEAPAPQYLCLCSKHGVQPPVALVEPRSGTVTPLFLLDPARLEASTETCADACLHSG
ncbi:hypothetical protein LMJF_35_0620 [Leishmania major strain Friedlin]|uniref:Transmembrane protein n=1 Tax=Leishmania major TaxID=5664 RepID=E9AEN7_LEIMA|nr:hypothetical protein LMJF_35_0620 [Leishmania major strain Friedlin]CAG9582413.1 hypothetical_protein_-_conserved [Leishmania major strain Friedlin]CBZ12690.1 hypothetical protein LMJF_35_0620 [Leishmania major strain Friedlin]|eukprot:XP_003722457.1 hypothetical protein LMJF_35_0620 [Leishmania major strain Friedlin]